MDISALNGSQASTGGTAASSSQTLGKDEFLKLFTTQLRAQDPLNPMDSTQFTSQLAQFSSLEQLTNINTQLKDLLLYQNSLQNTLATSMIGKQVTTTAGEQHTVTGITFDNGSMYLVFDGGGKAQLGDIKEIGGKA